MSDFPIPEWLKAEAEALAAAHAGDRMPHAVLIHAAPGVGGDWLAGWLTRLVLCERPERGACGECSSCRRVASSQHPDVLIVQPIEDSRQIRIEQVRTLSEELSLTSHQGGYKVGVLTPADSMNTFAANALLKTLEEPPPRTLLILVASQPSRLPPTILSRCQQLRVRTPSRQASVQWLESTRGKGDWNAVLDTLGEAPFFAAEADVQAIPRLGAEVRQALEDAVAGRGDPVATAERWYRSELPLRLRCIENWLTDRIRREFSSLRGARLGHIRKLFELTDAVRELRWAVDAPINRSLALENLLRRLAGEKI